MSEPMALYLADGIEEGRLDYATVMSNPRLSQFKEAVDLILIADGKQDLIVA